MTEQQVKYSLQTNKLQLNFWDKVSHFGIVVFLLFIPLLFVFFHIKDSLNGAPKPIKEGEIYFLIVPTLLAILFYKLQSDRLKFKEVITTLPRQHLNTIIEKVSAELKWYPEEINKNVIIAKTHPSFFSGSWGEQITIIFDTNRVLVNSICDPDKKSSIVSMGRNKKNENKLIKEIETASC
ncbi:MAG: hypothetical protein KF781_01365 [Chitinophagaceae bacterium]|nr:hypothetical protein [Chitinophagaceae bacterium]MCW5905383.1 hypothetical protein [Chitinophagaceae bacterium]